MARSTAPAGRLVLLAVAAGSAGAAAAQDVIQPLEVQTLTAVRRGGDVELSWPEVFTDVLGGGDAMDHYRVYRDPLPGFTPDKTGGANRVGTPPAPPHTDSPPGSEPVLFYIVSAVDSAGNEGNTRRARVTAASVLSGQATSSTIDLEWTDAEPLAEVSGYRLYYGLGPRDYDAVVEVGLATSHSLGGLAPGTTYYIAVTALDRAGNESAFSNEHQDRLRGPLTVDVRALDAAHVCPFNDCPPKGNEIVRRGGHEVLAPVDFPDGNWVNARLTLTVESRLCEPPIAPDKCGDQNPGWNPCGDPWDRTAMVFLVLDDCVETGQDCSQRDANVELLRAVTPFGTDAPAPDGSGRVPPRVWTYDVTPLAPLLRGRRHVGVMISTWVTPGWWATVDFHLSEDPAEASPKPPADGIAPAYYRSNGAAVDTGLDVAIPAAARQVFVRLFTTGHGGNADPACGAPADEFCRRTNRILVEGSPVFEVVPWRTCSSTCNTFNACGFPSCVFARSGWCPGEIACHENLSLGCDQDLDATAWLPAGGTYTLGYEVVGVNGEWSKSLTVYWYE